MTVVAPGAEVAERVMAEAWTAGALGIEERAEDRGVVMIVYLAAGDGPEPPPWLSAFADEGVRCEAIEVVPDEDWSEAWKAGLDAIVVSERLVVRPSFVDHRPSPGQHTVLIDPGRAFGTGGHASTRLALEWVDALAAEAPSRLAGARVLDVGTGSGVLAFAAVVLGAASAVGLDLDADAVREARTWAARNALADRIALYTGGIEALRPVGFDLVLANLLRTEMLPIAGEIAAAVAAGGALVLSGLLAADGPPVLEAFGRHGLVPAAERSREDANGDRWIAPLLVRPR
jgi:ribosomal protein L11 methyltransferase